MKWLIDWFKQKKKQKNTALKLFIFASIDVDGIVFMINGLVFGVDGIFVHNLF